MALVPLWGNCKSAKPGLHPVAARDGTAGGHTDKLYRTATWRVGVLQLAVESVTLGDVRHLETAQLSASVDVITTPSIPSSARLDIRAPSGNIGLA